MDHLEDVLNGVEDEIRRAEERLQLDVFSGWCARGPTEIHRRLQFSSMYYPALPVVATAP